MPRHPRLKEDADRRDSVDQPAGRLRQGIEPADGYSAISSMITRFITFTEADGSCGSDLKRIPGLPRKWKCETVQLDGVLTQLCTEIGVPLQPRVLYPVLCSIRHEPQRAPHQVE